MFIREITYSKHRQIETACEPNDDDVDDDDMHFSGSGIIIGVIVIIHICVCPKHNVVLFPIYGPSKSTQMMSGRELIISYKTSINV